MSEVSDLTEAPAGFLWLILTHIKHFSRMLCEITKYFLIILDRTDITFSLISLDDNSRLTL